MDTNSTAMIPPPLGALIVMKTFSILMVVIFAVGVLGNFLVIYVVGRFSSMQTVTNIYLLSLAIADTLYLFSIPFVIFVATNYNFPFGSFVCRFFYFLSSVNWFAGTFTLTALSADRYLAILYPLVTKRFRTPCYTSIAVLFIWLLSICLMVPVFINAEVIEKPENRWSCSQKWSSNAFTVVGFTMYTFIFGYLIPCILIIFFYSRVIYRLKTVGPAKKSKEKKESQKKTTRLVLAVILVYVLCWLPYWVHQLNLLSSVWTSGGEKSFKLDNTTTVNETSRSRLSSGSSSSQILRYFLTLIFQLIGYVNSAVNPVLYSFISVNFRKSFMKVFTCAFFASDNGGIEGRTRNTEGRNGSCSRHQQTAVTGKPSEILSEDLRLVTFQTTFGPMSGGDIEEEAEENNRLIGDRTPADIVLEPRPNMTSLQETAID